MKGEQSVQIIKRPNLTKAQKALFELIQDRLSNDKPILFIEAKSIYVEKACHNVKDGIPLTWNNWKYQDENGEWHGGWQPMTDYDLTQRVIYWITANIGCLVFNGSDIFLTVS